MDSTSYFPCLIVFWNELKTSVYSPPDVESNSTNSNSLARSQGWKWTGLESSPNISIAVLAIFSGLKKKKSHHVTL